MKLQTLFDHFLFHFEVERGLSTHTVDAYRHDLNQYAVFLGSGAAIRKALKVTQLKALQANVDGIMTPVTKQRNVPFAQKREWDAP